jgi:hypothetical protein
MGMPQGKKKGLSTKKFDRCVTKVKCKGGAKNPYAICNASMGGKPKSNGKGKSDRKSNTKLYSFYLFSNN